MVDRNLEEGEEQTKPKTGFGLLGTGGLLLTAAVAGVSLPWTLPKLIATEVLETVSRSATDSGDSLNRMTYLPFGEVTVNLDEGRMNRYLRLKMSLQIKESDQQEIAKILETKQLILKNWLLSHLSDKTLDEIRGKAGQNMLRRELKNYFNSVMFMDGRERIHDILFEEFNVQ